MTNQPPTAYVAARRVGDATITIISEAAAVGSVGLPIPEAEWRRAIPEADLRGMISFGLNLAHIQLGDASCRRDGAAVRVIFLLMHALARPARGAGTLRHSS